MPSNPNQKSRTRDNDVLFPLNIYIEMDIALNIYIDMDIAIIIISLIMTVALKHGRFLRSVKKHLLTTTRYQPESFDKVAFFAHVAPPLWNTIPIPIKYAVFQFHAHVYNQRKDAYL